MRLNDSQVFELGRINDKLNRCLFIVDEELYVNYANNHAKSVFGDLSHSNRELLSRCKSIPGIVSERRVFFMVDKDLTEQQEVWFKLQLQKLFN